MENLLQTKRNIDVVFCIDGTGSMSPCIESVKKNAKRLYDEFLNKLTESNSVMDSMRIKVIVFRDYGSDTNAMEISPFFELPDDNADYENFMNNIEASGGGDAPENGLEALYCAMKSDFTTGPKDRQVIVLFTDTDALPLKARSDSENYPTDMVDEDGLIDTWTCNNQDLKLREKLKRLVIFAPADTKYSEISKSFNRVMYVPVNTSQGLDDVSFDDVIKMLVASASNA